MRIYISLPISGHDLATQRGAAREIADKIRTLGHEPVDPFDSPEAPARLSERERYAHYMGEDIKRLLMCDAAYFHSGWSCSRGCNAEWAIAHQYGLQCFLSLPDIPPAIR